MDDGTRRLGAVALMGGGALAIVFGALHAGPRRGDTRLFLEDLQGSEIWLADHFGLAVAFLLLLAGIAAVTRAIGTDGESAVTRVAWPVAVVGVAAALVNVAVDGPAMKAVADRWDGDPDLFAAAEVLHEVDIAGFTLWTVVLIGLTPILYGAAMLRRGSSFPRWLGWLAVAAGGLGLVTGILQWFRGLFPVAVFVLHPTASGLLAVWAMSAGVVLWRRGQVLRSAA